MDESCMGTTAIHPESDPQRQDDGRTTDPAPILGDQPACGTNNNNNNNNNNTTITQQNILCQRTAGGKSG